MKCPVCGAWTQVKLTRQSDEFVRRSRVCGNEHRFTTEERAVPDSRQRLKERELSQPHDALLGLAILSRHLSSSP
jgi:transcriptional regulator NrdR family protein